MKTVTFQDKTIHFVSTAHVSKESVNEVKETIETIQPEVVCIELDDNRAEHLMNPGNQEDVDIKTIIKNKKMPSFAANLILSSYQKRMAEQLDTSVGAEMKQAIESAQEFEIPLRYIDRDVQVTFKRIWGNLKMFKRIELLTSLIFSAFESDEINEDDIESLKQSDLLYESVKELDDKLPEISRVLLHERNEYMAEKIKALPYNNVVVVIGAAHTEGIIECLDQEHDIYELNQIPPKKKKSFKNWIIPGTIIMMILVLSFKNPNLGAHQFISWILLSAGLATLGAILCGAHPLTILTTFISAPIGTLSPFLAVGFFAGLMEAYQRPPRVSDFDAVPQDISSFKKWYSNRVLRIIMIMLATNLLSTIGTFISGGQIFSNLLH